MDSLSLLDFANCLFGARAWAWAWWSLRFLSSFDSPCDFMMVVLAVRLLVAMVFMAMAMVHHWNSGLVINRINVRLNNSHVWTVRVRNSWLTARSAALGLASAGPHTHFHWRCCNLVMLLLLTYTRSVIRINIHRIAWLKWGKLTCCNTMLLHWLRNNLTTSIILHNHLLWLRGIACLNSPTASWSGSNVSSGWVHLRSAHWATSTIAGYRPNMASTAERFVMVAFKFALPMCESISSTFVPIAAAT